MTRINLIDPSELCDKHLKSKKSYDSYFSGDTILESKLLENNHE